MCNIKIMFNRIANVQQKNKYSYIMSEIQSRQRVVDVVRQLFLKNGREMAMGMGMARRMLSPCFQTILLVMACHCYEAWGLELPEIIGSHAVFQQQSHVKLWGWAEPGTEVIVRVSWDNATQRCQAASDGLWETYVDTPEASFSTHAVTIEGDGTTLCLDDILIGEVWLCSGQSNMVMPLEGLRNCPTEGGNEEIALSSAYGGRVRVATIPQDQSIEQTPASRVHGKWSTPSPDVAASYSAVAWFYAKTLTDMLHVPVGVIVCAWGGSRVEGWLPREYLVANAMDEDLSCRLSPEGPNKSAMNLPMIMYNGLLNPVIGYGVKGVLWFQGESNVRRGRATYARRFTDMVEIWRKAWGRKPCDMPFYTVELTPHAYKNPKGKEAAEFRDMQHSLSESIPYCGCVSTNDLMYDYEVDNIHGSMKRQIGQRLAFMAAVRTYGVGDSAMCDAPRYESMRQGKNGSVILVFKNAGNGFSRFTDIPGFEAAGEDRVFHPASVRVTMKFNELELRCEDVKGDIVAVRYNYYNWAPGHVWNTRGLPVVPFRTDNWPLDN